MSCNADTSDVSGRFEVPVVRSRLRFLVLNLLLLGTVVFAVRNLGRWSVVPIVSVIASLFWLGLVGLMLWYESRTEGGLRRVLVNWLGGISSHEFVDVIGSPDACPLIRYGYELFGRRLFRCQVPRDSILSVSWSAGQASDRLGRDMDDWSVVFWYRRQNHDARALPGFRDENVCFVGPSGSRERTEAFGQSFVAFLRTTGLDLEADTQPHKYVHAEH